MGYLMTKPSTILDIESKEVVVVYKDSRYFYIKQWGSPSEQERLADLNNPITKDLLKAHENNLQAIDNVKASLDNLGIKYRLYRRSEIKKHLLKNAFIITMGGDGTLLDTSHYCDDSPILGVNTDPLYSIGALCAASVDNFLPVLHEIYDGKLLPTALSRLSISIDDHEIELLALNDVLFAHKNPASMSRFSLSCGARSESHRSSGLWVATAAGSTGGIYSSGASPLPIEEDLAIFRVREPYWSDQSPAQLLDGTLKRNDMLTIRSNMTDAQIFIDGPHKILTINFGQKVDIRIAGRPLWLFDGPRLVSNRMNIIKQRKALHSLS
jgi:NAD+ kinase